MTDCTDIAAQMKRGMRHLASGVAVVATCDERGVPFAMTVSSVTSLSDQPPSLLVCLHRSSQTHSVLQRIDNFSVNLLTIDQREVSENCAIAHDNRQLFNVGDWRDHPDNQLPFLAGALAVFYCKAEQRIDYGTHTIIIANICSVSLSGQESDPLIYCRGAYYQLQ